MTDPPALHLDDEQLSAALDGEGVPEHLEACSVCRTRRASLEAARRAVGSPVPTLAPDVIDAAIASAVASADGPVESPTATTSSIDGRRRVPSGPRRRRLAAPPPAWLVGAAAAIAVLAGLAVVVRSTRGEESGSPVSQSANDLTSADASVEAAAADAASGAGGAVAATDPELVTADLGDQTDPATLTTRLAASPRMAGNLDTAAAAPAAGDETSSAGPATPTGKEPEGAADRAQCRDEATRIGAGRLGVLLSTSRLRWAGQPAEVLVFALTEPAEGVRRQALVMARPGCGLLADPRF